MTHFGSPNRIIKKSKQQAIQSHYLNICSSCKILKLFNRRWRCFRSPIHGQCISQGNFFLILAVRRYFPIFRVLCARWRCIFNHRACRRYRNLEPRISKINTQKQPQWIIFLRIREDMGKLFACSDSILLNTMLIIWVNIAFEVAWFTGLLLRKYKWTNYQTSFKWYHSAKEKAAI